MTSSSSLDTTSDNREYIDFDLFIASIEYVLLLRRISKTINITRMNTLLDEMTEIILENCEDNCLEEARQYLELASLREKYLFDSDKEVAVNEEA